MSDGVCGSKVVVGRTEGRVFVFVVLACAEGGLIGGQGWFG